MLVDDPFLPFRNKTSHHAQCVPNGKFKVYCHKIPNGAMQEFLTLPATGTKSKFFDNIFPVNSASYKCGQNCKSRRPGDSTLTTVYSKIRINPCSFEVDVTGKLKTSDYI